MVHAAEPSGLGASASERGRRIVLTTFGSFGDLHPYIALGLGLKARGHEPILCTSRVYREKIEGEGLGFHPLRPDLPEGEETLRMVRRIMDPRTGTEYVIRDLMMPHLREQYEDLLSAVRGADLLVSHSLSYAAPLLAEKLGLPWVGSVLQPMVFCSAYDPPVPPNSPPWLLPLRSLPPWLLRPIFNRAKAELRKYVRPVDELRAELGLPPGGNPIFEGQFSPYLNLALFSETIARPQPDWPANTVVAGFPLYDRLSAGAGMPPELVRFLDQGPAPIVFTLGTSAVWLGGDFYVESARAASRLGQRAVLLVGKDTGNRLPDPLPEGVIACEYAPHSELFPRAAAIVIQGGIGTTAQAMRAGKPTLVVPFAHDQPDNGVRLARLGVGRTLPSDGYTADSATRELRRLLDDPAYSTKAEAVGRKIAAEDGVGVACDALEQLL
ncbi:MAG TPA: glycosyltransferase, partial [Armatimonadota bacterium]|nr:glycosyltransferase [Armatimonadota bacterium]